MADEHLSDAFIKSLHARVVQMEQDMAHNAEATARNTDSIETIRQNTQDIVDTFAALAGGFKVLQGLGRLARPIGYIATAIAATLAAVAAVKGIWK
jgi:hypothetical protein